MAKMQKPAGIHPQRDVLVRISVHDVGGKVYDGVAQVRLMREGETVTLKRPSGSLFHEAWVEPGAYQLDVSTKDLVSPGRRVEIGPDGKIDSAYLGKEGWPFYRLGSNAVPFPPPGDLLAVAFPLRQPDPEATEKLVGQITQRLPLEPYPLREAEQQTKDTRRRRKKGEKQQADFVVGDGAIWLFRFTEEATPELRRQAAVQIRDLIHEEVRVGVPVDLKRGQVKVIDNRFVVRFREGIELDEIEALVKEAEGRILRGFVQSPNARLVEFPAGDFGRHLEIIENWYEQGLLVYGEPDILAQIADDVFPDDAPDDPTYPNQANLTLQQVDVAWRILSRIDPTRTLGSSTVYVATLDRGVELGHPDIGGNLTDGASQISRCYDFSGLRECTVSGYAPDTDHGMGVYGIVAARTDNNEDIAGIAPNTHQIAIERPNLTSVNYSDVLLWAAGFITGNATPPIAVPGWPGEPLSPAADIISCSHGSDGLALSGIMNDTLHELADNGRGGLGTLVIYSAGNSTHLITGFRTWAAHPDTMAIANSMQPDAAGVEHRDPTSNFGPEIDVCAQGTGAPSLNASGGEQTFGGTSAAAPTVAAISALMLSVDPTMTWQDLRDMLRDTAVQIDAANTDPVGQWVGGFSQWYGVGRVNAASAVCGAKPTVTLQTPAIAFNDIPEGETTLRAAVFAVESCQPVTLRLVSGPGADFTTPLGTSTELDTAGAASPRETRIWIGYTATTDGDTANGSLTVRWDETEQEWTVPITANTTGRSNAAVLLALDQSNSMSFDSGLGPGITRGDVLKFSAPPLVDVMEDDDAIGIISFDHDPHDVMPVTPVVPSGRMTANGHIADYTHNPSGWTCIGEAVARAHEILDQVTGYNIKAMIVLTDGRQNHDGYSRRYISDVADLINEHVYAIGLGTAENIQPSALHALCDGHEGYLLMTGALDIDAYFRLAKYYQQILAGVQNKDIIVDPEGFVKPGQTHLIPFSLNEADISSDVILLTPAPYAFKFSLETPIGDVIDPGIAAANPVISFLSGSDASYYRVTLPVPIGGSEAREGTWHAVLTIDDDYYKRYLAGLDNYPEECQRVLAHGVRYNLSVHSYSNLRLRASLSQTSYEPGAKLVLRAVITEYGLPVESRAAVQSVLERPDSTTTAVALAEVEPGVFETSAPASMSGIYRLKVSATGKTLRGRRFVREQTLTGAVWQGGDERPPSSKDDPQKREERLCKLLTCLMNEKVVGQYIAEKGINVEAVKECLRSFCEDPRPSPGDGVVGVRPEITQLLADPCVRAALSDLVELIRLS
jgi:hypothetical protein